MLAEIRGERFADEGFGRTGWRAVVVGEVEVGEAEIEGAPQHPPGFVGVGAGAEIMPAAEGDGGKFQAAATAAPVLHGVITAHAENLPQRDRGVERIGLAHKLPARGRR